MDRFHSDPLLFSVQSSLCPPGDHPIKVKRDSSEERRAGKELSYGWDAVCKHLVHANIQNLYKVSANFFARTIVVQEKSTGTCCTILRLGGEGSDTHFEITPDSRCLIPDEAGRAIADAATLALRSRS